jgi:hypothetical protein
VHIWKLNAVYRSVVVFPEDICRTECMYKVNSEVIYLHVVFLQKVLQFFLCYFVFRFILSR